ncbi:MAG TPA: OmpA family protein, partial [Eudoraea sp.]|nr:OmpA family protein [Eudoraea sp.]
SPFIYEHSFYFSSDIFYGLGGMDIYKSEMGSQNFFSIPINLGKEVNSDKDDFGFIMKDNIGAGLIGYFSSNRDGGKGNDDIYGFLVSEKPGLKTLVIGGEITNSVSNSDVSKASVKILDGEDNLIKEIYTAENGTYRVEVPWMDALKLEISKERYSFFTQTYDKTEIEQLENNITLDVDLTLLDDIVQEREGQTVIKMNKFFFAPRTHTLTPEITVELDRAVEAVHKFPNLQLRIEAHTDSRGGSVTNFRLSQQRADAIKNYLLEKGVPSSSILYTVGYGEEKITNQCKNGVFCLEILHKQNERHLIVVLNYDLLYD